MPRSEKPIVDITNRPSERDQHSVREWASHIHDKETQDTHRDIMEARDRLGQFSVRFVAEAIYCEDVAARIYGENGGQELVRDMKIDHKTLKTLAGNVGGERAANVVEKSVLREVEVKETPIESDGISDQQVELLRALLKTMDPNVIKRALSGS